MDPPPHPPSSPLPPSIPFLVPKLLDCWLVYWISCWALLITISCMQYILNPPPPSQQFLFWWILSTKKRGNDLKIFKLSVGLILKSKNLKLSVCLLYKSKNTWLVELPAWYPLCPVWIEINGFPRFWSSDIGSHINIQFKHFFLISGQLT